MSVCDIETALLSSVNPVKSFFFFFTGIYTVLKASPKKKPPLESTPHTQSHTQTYTQHCHYLYILHWRKKTPNYTGKSVTRTSVLSDLPWISSKSVRTSPIILWENITDLVCFSPPWACTSDLPNSILIRSSEQMRISWLSIYTC